jgi:hypothetical protein
MFFSIVGEGVFSEKMKKGEFALPFEMSKKRKRDRAINTLLLML